MDDNIYQGFSLEKKYCTSKENWRRKQEPSDSLESLHY